MKSRLDLKMANNVMLQATYVDDLDMTIEDYKEYLANMFLNTGTVMVRESGDDVIVLSRDISYIRIMSIAENNKK